MIVRTIFMIAFVGLVGAMVAPAPSASAKGKWGKKLKQAGYVGDIEGTREILKKIVDAGDVDGASDILEAMAFMSVEDLLDDILRAFDSFGVEPLAPIFDEYVSKKRDKDPIGCSCIFRFAAKFTDEASEKWLLSGMESTNAITIRNVLEASIERKSKNAIPKLIGQLETLNPKKYKLIRFEIEDTLYALTEMEFDVVEDWKNWWEVNGSHFDPKSVGADDKEKATGVRKRKRSKDSPEFFGVEILSSNIMFVIDTSGSMQLWDPATGESGGSADWQKRQRIQRVKNQLIRAISELKRSSKFNIVGFSNRVLEFQKKGIVPAATGPKKKALKWVSSLQANGATHTDDAMKTAFKDKKIDTIMLLSDGAPTRQGGNSDQIIAQILRDVKKWNKIRKVKIYTFGFEGPGRFPPNSRQQGQPAANPAFSDFLKKLSSENGGTHTSID